MSSGVGDILVSVKIEREEIDAGTAGLYAEHEVKDELVLGPMQLQRQDTGSASQCLYIPAVRCIRHDHSYIGEVHCDHPYAIIDRKYNNEWDAADDSCVGPGSARVKEDPECSVWRTLEVEVKWEGGPDQQNAFSMMQSQDQAETGTIKQELAEIEPSRETPCAAQLPLALRPCSVALESTFVEKLLHKCTICSRTFLHKSSLMDHPCIESNSKVSKTSTNQKIENLYICDSCKKHFAFKKDLIRHLQVHFRYSYTESLFTDSTCLRDYNIESCTKSCQCKNKTFFCDICKKKFNKFYLTQHSLVHSRDKPFACDICKKTYRQRSLLIQHKLVHTGEKPYSCEICQKTFIDRSNFLRHKLAHSADKPYACHICQKTFKHRYSLNNHQVVHTGEKPFVCEICNKAFSERSSVRRHLLLHTGEKPHACDVCPKTFRRQSHLKYHMQSHTGR